MGKYIPSGSPAYENARLAQRGVTTGNFRGSFAEYDGDKNHGAGPSAAQIAEDYARGMARESSAKAAKAAHDNVLVIVSRHPAVLAWLNQPGGSPGVGYSMVNLSQGREVKVITGDATPDDVRDRIVVGNIPFRLAALARCVLAIEFAGAPPRGQEYTLADMVSAGAELREYVVRPVDPETESRLHDLTR